VFTPAGRLGLTETHIRVPSFGSLRVPFECGLDVLPFLDCYPQLTDERASSWEGVHRREEGVAHIEEVHRRRRLELPLIARPSISGGGGVV